MEKKIVIKFNDAFFMIEVFSKLVIEENSLRQTKNIYKKPTTSIMVNVKILNTISPKRGRRLTHNVNVQKCIVFLYIRKMVCKDQE